MGQSEKLQTDTEQCRAILRNELLKAFLHAPDLVVEQFIDLKDGKSPFEPTDIRSVIWHAGVIQTRSWIWEFKELYCGEFDEEHDAYLLKDDAPNPKDL